MKFKQITFIKFFLFFIFSFIFVEIFHVSNNTLPSRHGDDAVYFNSAFNISKFKISSSQIEEYRVENHKNAIKPPLYSFFLAQFINPNKNVNLECVYKKIIPTNCLEFVQKAKKINLYIHYFHVFLIYIIILIITKNNVLSFLGGFLLLSSTYFLKTTNLFLTENFSSLLLLVHSFGFYMMFSTKKNRSAYLVISSLTLGLLILTKAIFLYWFYFLLVFFAVYILKKKLFNFLKINSNYFFYYLNEKKIIYFFLLILIIITPWQLRNFIDKGEFKISLQGGNVIAERVEYLKTKTEDIKYGILFYTPFKSIKDRYKDELLKTSFMFDENSLNSHYVNSDNLEKGYVLSELKWNEKNKSDKIFEKSLEIIKKNPIKHLYLTFMFYVRGIFLETQNNEYPIYLQIISSVVHWTSILLTPIIFFHKLLVVDKKILLIMPSTFIIVAYSFFTDFEPRYGSIISSTYILIIMIYLNNIFEKLFNK
jgi:hypothetical protein